MAVQRDQPYRNQHFLVDLGDGEPTPFAEVVLPGISLDVIEYREGSAKESGTRKIPGLARYDNAILRRGATGSLSLYQWVNDIRNGNVTARRTVTISLMSEDLASPVLTWKLLRAWPCRHRYSDLEGKGTDVVMEELVLAYERLDME